MTDDRVHLAWFVRFHYSEFVFNTIYSIFQAWTWTILQVVLNIFKYKLENVRNYFRI